MTESVSFLTPVGRLVQGSLYKGATTDAEGGPLVVKTGPQAGQPRTDYFFAIAIPKGPEPHWNQTDWGAKIWSVGQKSYPNGQANSPTFAWKITDGDSTIPNRAGRKPIEREGFKGHWVLSFSSGYAPKIYNSNGTAPLLEEDAVKLGYYIQVAGTCAGNGSTQQPGVYLNHNMVAHAGYGPEIVLGPDPRSVGFGQAPLPAGASATPVGGMSAPPPAAPPPAAAPAPAAVQPHPAFLQPTAAPPAAAAPPPPPLPPAAPAAPTRKMLPAAQGASYEQMIGAGWTDDLLIQHGMMVAF